MSKIEPILNNCMECGEDAVLVKFSGQCFVRVRRKSKCKRPRMYKCQTETFRTEEEAVSHWNRRVNAATVVMG
jgi:hypothetical protein